jgi:hypothetical protein
MEYTLAGMAVLLHRIGWSVLVPARRATERDEDKIARGREDTWPVIKHSGGPGRLALLGRRVRPGPEAAEGPNLGPPGHTPVVAVTGGHDTRVSLAALRRDFLSSYRREPVPSATQLRWPKQAAWPPAYRPRHAPSAARGPPRCGYRSRGTGDIRVHPGTLNGCQECKRLFQAEALTRPPGLAFRSFDERRHVASHEVAGNGWHRRRSQVAHGASRSAEEHRRVRTVARRSLPVALRRRPRAVPSRGVTEPGCGGRRRAAACWMAGLDAPAYVP